MAAAEEALAKTPEQLPVLKKAGVVDAGGQGLVLIFQGMGAVLEKGTVVQPIAGSAVTPFMHSTWGLVVSLGLLSAIGSGASSFSVLIGAAAPLWIVALIIMVALEHRRIRRWWRGQ